MTKVHVRSKFKMSCMFWQKNVKVNDKRQKLLNYCGCNRMHT